VLAPRTRIVIKAALPGGANSIASDQRARLDRIVIDNC